MKKLTDGQVANLLLLKAMEDSVGTAEGWDSLNDVIDDIFADNAVDIGDVMQGVMELTQLGLINSDIKNEEDLEMSEAVGYDIEGLTPDGEKYVEEYLKQGTEQDVKQDMEQWNPTVKEKFIARFNQISDVCGKISENGIVKLIGTFI